MPLSRSAVGLTTSTHTHHADARWTMAYAAAINDNAEQYMDTSRAGGVVAHPMFVICPEWPVALESRAQLAAAGLSEDEANRGVHAAHDCHIHRLVNAGETLTTRATVIDIREHRAGASVITRFDNCGALDEPVATTYSTQIYRDVALSDDGDVLSDAFPAFPRNPKDTADLSVSPLAIPWNLAHTYTECGRIFNPIHTDQAFAQAAGLPEIILHGSATLALAVSAVVAHTRQPAKSVTRISARFRGMVTMPNTLSLRLSTVSAGEKITAFSIDDESGDCMLSDGQVAFGD